jgi:uncharacterized protein (DUF1697 family)
MGRQVALLRGINVGGARKVAMTELRELFETLGYDDVETFIQSGNVIFSADKPSVDDIEAAMLERFGIPVDVIIRTHAELAKTIASDPFPDADRSHVHIGYMRQAPARGVVQQLELASFTPEEARFVRREVYLHLPNGMGRSKLPAYVGRRIPIPTTVRNWNTSVKLMELTAP